MQWLDEFEMQATGRLSALEELDAWSLPWMATAFDSPNGYVKWVTDNALKGLDMRSGLDPHDKAQARLHLERQIGQMRANMEVMMNRAARRQATQQSENNQG